MAKAAVSVLIPTYNRAQFLPECLDSVFGQTVPPAQVIVINDGSTDNTRQVLEPYMGKIEYLEQENRGKSSALNLAMSHVQGDYVWIMDDDDVALPNALETHLRVLEGDPSAGYTYSARYMGRTRPQDGRVEKVELEPLANSQDDEFFPRLLESFFSHQSAMLVRVSSYKEVGPFDTTLVRSQDYEMMLRLARRFPGKGIAEPTVCIRRHPGMRGSAADRFEAGEAASKWREYDQRLIARFRKMLELHEYLPRRFHGKGLGPADKRRAYLQSMTVMAAKAMFPEMLQDLQSAITQTGPDLPLTPDERAIVRRSVGYMRPADLSKLRCLGMMRALPKGRAVRDVKIELARGLSWRAEWAVRSHRYRELVTVLQTGYNVLGLGGIFLAVMAKLRESWAALRSGRKPIPGAPVH